jgi:hypothetical protein
MTELKKRLPEVATAASSQAENNKTQSSSALSAVDVFLTVRFIWLRVPACAMDPVGSAASLVVGLSRQGFDLS